MFPKSLTGKDFESIATKYSFCDWLIDEKSGLDSGTSCFFKYQPPFLGWSIYIEILSSFFLRRNIRLRFFFELILDVSGADDLTSTYATKLSGSMFFYQTN